MSDYRDLLEQERRRFRMPGSMRDLERRRERRRRNRRVASGLVALIIAAAGIGAGLYALRPTGSVKPVVTPTPTVAPPVSRALMAPSGPIQFVDAKTGWAVGPNGEILATSDGGERWMGQYTGPMKIVGVQFVDAMHGWAVADKGLLQTVDGGGNWEPVNDQSFSSVQFVTSSVGWAVEAPLEPNGQLLETTDGGQTWKFQARGVQTVCAANDKLVWIAGSDEAGGMSLARSDDGGFTWAGTPLSVPEGEPWTATLRCAGTDAWVLLTDGGAAGHLPYVVYQAIEAGPDSMPVLQEVGTRPVGYTKGVVDAQDPYPGPLTAFDGQQALFVGWCPACGNSMALYATSDGGKHWGRTNLVRQGATPLGMSFADRDHGWILFQKGQPPTPKWTVMATSDGGKTWLTLG